MTDWDDYGASQLVYAQMCRWALERGDSTGEFCATSLDLRSMFGCGGERRRSGQAVRVLEHLGYIKQTVKGGGRGVQNRYRLLHYDALFGSQ